MAVIDNDKCPRCGQRFEDGDITGILPWPFGNQIEKYKWHLRCHQDSYYADLYRDRRDPRAIPTDERK